MAPVVRRRLGKGLTRRRVGISGTSKIGDGVPRYMVDIPSLFLFLFLSLFRSVPLKTNFYMSGIDTSSR